MRPPPVVIAAFRIDCGATMDTPASLPMFDQIPVRVWLMIALAAKAYAPASYIIRHWMHSPAKRDITQPPEDFSWRTSRRLVVQSAVLAALAALAVAIFTPAAERFARSPEFWPLVILLIGGVASWTVLRGIQVGRISPIVRGVSETFQRTTQPKRFWASVGWNAFLGLAFLLSGTKFLSEVPEQAISARCRDLENDQEPRVSVAACNELIRDFKPEGEELAAIVASRGAAHYQAGEYLKALRDYDTALTYDPKVTSTWYNRGLVNERLGEYDIAINDYSESVNSDSENYGAYVNRGILYLNKENIAAAIADFDRVLKVDPDNIDARANRGLCFVWRGDIGKAQRDFAAVRSAAPSSPALLHGEAMLSMRAGDTAAAIRQLTAALHVDPGDQWALGARASAYRRLGDSMKAQADLAVLTRLERAEYASHYPTD